MTIEPIVPPEAPASAPQPGRTQGGDREKLDGAAGSGARVDISGKAQSIHDAAAHARLDAIKERVQHGYYLQHHVIDHIVDCLAGDIGTSSRS